MLVGKAYKTIKLSNLCALLGLSESEVKQREYTNPIDIISVYVCTC